jgi:putative ABC transport system permease protein
MIRVALAMLFGDPAKYISLIVGLAFASLLTAQQGAIFLGLIQLGTGVLQNIRQADLWVTDPSTQYVAEYRPLADREVQRVRSVPGVQWAQPVFASRGTIDLADGGIYTSQIIGLERSALIGQPPEMVEGSLDDLRAPDAVIIDTIGRTKLGNPSIGDELKINERRAVVVGFCRARPGFEGNAIIYTTLENAYNFVPAGRKKISYILVKARDGEDPAAVAERINALPGLAALTRDEFAYRTSMWVLRETGIGINFSITVLLGFIVGLVVSASILYQFTSDNIRHFAVLKAMGATRRVLVGMVGAQALTVGLIGYGIGVGIAGAFGMAGRQPEAQLVAYFPWQLMALSFAAILICVVLGSLLSVRRVLTVEPGIVFR